jgi:hypothetical protein
MNKGMRLMLGFLIAPAVAPVSYVIFFIAWAWFQNARGIDINPISLLPPIGKAIFPGIPVAYIFTLLIVVPYVLVMEFTHHLNFATVMIPIVLLIVTLVTLGQSYISFMPRIEVALGIISSGVCFYFLAVRNDPKGQTKKK